MVVTDETLAAIAEQAGASRRLASLQFAQGTQDRVPTRITVSEHVNPVPAQQRPSEQNLNTNGHRPIRP